MSGAFDSNDSNDSHGSNDSNGGPPSNESGEDQGGVFPPFACTLGPPKAAARSVVRALFFLVLLAFALAVFASERGHPTFAELSALTGCLFLALAIPARSIASRVATHPDACRFVLARDGFRLPWLNANAPGPEGPWEALRAFRVRQGHGASRILVLEVAAGRLAISDGSIGRAAFDAAVKALERALGPEGVLLGTVVRLPIQRPDGRSLGARTLDALPAMLIALVLIGLAGAATTIAIRIIAAALAVLWVWLTLTRGFSSTPEADLALGLDGLSAPLPEDPRRSVKVPFESLVRTAVEEVKPDQHVLVIEHESGRLAYPLEWLDARHARDFARELASRRRDRQGE